MQHLDEGVLQELLDGEIPSSELGPIQAHLATCAECRARLEEAREFAGEADRLIEAVQITGEDDPRTGVVPLRPAPKRWGRDLAWAATVVIAVGAGYMARGSTPPRVTALQDSAAPVLPTVPMVPAESTPVAPAQGVTTQPERRRDAPADTRQEESKDAAAVPPPPAAQVKAEDRAKLAAETVAPTAGAGGRSAGVPAPATHPSARTAAPQRAMLEQSAAANEVRLDELGKLSVARKRVPAAVEILLSEALRRLGGSLRLIEGLVPVRLEAADTSVRVVYPLATGELVLEQWLADGRISYRLVAPASFPADSLDRLRARVRE